MHKNATDSRARGLSIQTQYAHGVERNDDAKRFFCLQDQYQKLSELGDPLEVINRVVEWEVFRPVLKKALRKSRKNHAGRKPFDAVLMFKVLVVDESRQAGDISEEIFTTIDE